MRRANRSTWRVRNRLLVTGVLALAVLGVAPAASANASTPSSSPPNCVMVLGKVTAASHNAPIVSYTCGSDTNSAVSPDCVFNCTLLMTWYSQSNYQGSSTTVYENFGPCDQSGYGISYVGDSWNDRIHSWKVFNKCYYSSDFKDSNYGGSFANSTCDYYQNNVAVRDYGIDTFGISSFWLSYGKYAWSVCTG